MGRRVRCFLGCCLDRERRATGAKQEATKDGGSYERANGSEFKSWKQLKHAERSKSAHNEGMLRCVECSADVGLTFALQYVYASEETMRVSQDSLASLGLFAVVVDGCWCG